MDARVTRELEQKPKQLSKKSNTHHRGRKIVEDLPQNSHDSRVLLPPHSYQNETDITEQKPQTKWMREWSGVVKSKENLRSFRCFPYLRKIISLSVLHVRVIDFKGDIVLAQLGNWICLISLNLSLSTYVNMLEEECLFRSPSLLCIFVGFLLYPVVSALIPLGSKLSVVDRNYWLSSNGDFAFGFFNISDEPNQYSAGIRFNSKSMPYDQQTVVWVAGANVKVGNRSYFQFTPEGELVLFDSLKGSTEWRSGTGNRAIVSASLHDDGNLVLIDTEQNIIWQSFDTPSDTLLPGQSLSVYEILRATTKNATSSSYTLYMNPSGQLQLRWDSNIIYWTSEIPPSASNMTAILTTGGALQLRDKSLTPFWSVFGDDHNDSVNYRFLRLDVDGNLRLYSWIEASQSWRSVWQAVENQCKVFATCGQRGVCVFTASGSTDCWCPFDVSESNQCLIPYEYKCESGYSMLTYKKTYLYGIYPPDDSVVISSLQQCEQLCLNDTQCTVATFSHNAP
ncbi:unnamed protein product [Sphenostylis stenocarpa]|uniref:non-specific serine/threonine protein kinase n=1 Tax=Sphenostylis stenocarpa TaxID=92480 RepID=A0AA86S554_9FABA|nr:unnamed protein product [Sphenostylis stenocarpa]